MAFTVPIFNTETEIPVLEHFYTIQGEGNHTGRPAYFIRTSGCDIGCVWCDVKESWDVTAEQMMPIAELIKIASSYPARTVVVTGGESLMFDMQPLTLQLKQAGFITHLETSGAYPLSGQWDWICLSPKKFKKPIEGFHADAHELKVIIYNKSDFDWAEEHAAKVNGDCVLYLQPEWSVADKMQPAIIEYVKAHPQWRISLQTHKYLDIP
jgi:7-carboxy-7-deazaguanine synthase